MVGDPLSYARLVVGAATCAACALATPAACASEASPTEPDVHPTLAWALVQLVPSPEVVVVGDGQQVFGRDDPGAPAVHFGVRWQITPFYWATGLRRGLSPLRTFVVEPRLRAGGGVEVYFAPELVTANLGFSHDWFLRPGARAYVPLMDKGETLSFSLGAQAVIHAPDVGPAFEAGVYTMAGSVGLQAAFVPTKKLRMTTLTLAIRYF
jgi:hypothetical protein